MGIAMTTPRLEVNPMRTARLTIVALAVSLVGAGWPQVAQAHAEPVSSSPAAGAAVATPPESVTIVFDGELLPDGTGFTVTDHSGRVVGEGELDLTVADRNQLSGLVEINGAGTFTVAWTAVSADGHAEEGSFEFSVADAAEPPNTAAAMPHRQVPTALGPILLIAALLIGVRRARRSWS
jgi:copper resistance protein C